MVQHSLVFIRYRMYGCRSNLHVSPSLPLSRIQLEHPILVEFDSEMVAPDRLDHFTQRLHLASNNRRRRHGQCKKIALGGLGCYIIYLAVFIWQKGKGNS